MQMKRTLCALTAALLLLAGLVAAWFVLPAVLAHSSRRVGRA